MKKNRIHIFLVLLVGVAALSIFFSCQKSRYCYCTSSETETPDTVIWNLDRGLKCDRLMKMGKEVSVQVVDDSATGRSHTEVKQLTYTYSCKQLDEDTLSVFDSLNVE